MPASWKDELAHAYRSSEALLKPLGLNQSLPFLHSPHFPVLCTVHYASKIQPTPHDPLLRQILATPDEWIQDPTFVKDPVDDAAAQTEPGILQKYQGRLLVVSTGRCAIHCRFCFRRNYPYGKTEYQNLAFRLERRLQADASITEVILSGGDPLTLDDSSLFALLDACNQPTVQRIRIHSRIPLTLPSRFTPELFQKLGSMGSQLVFVVHCNHAQELDDASNHIFFQLKLFGATLLNQSVLLAGVNDHADALCQLSYALFQQGVLPYYLHQLDRVEGARHFEVPEDQARQLVEQLRIRLPGYLVPRWVREIPGEPSKTPLAG